MLLNPFAAHRQEAARLRAAAVARAEAEAQQAARASAAKTAELLTRAARERGRER
jgi:hypothetical protein